MKAIVNTRADGLKWLEVPLPRPAPGQVRIRTAACGICTTDLEMIAGWDRTGFPSIPGHEWSGVVDAAGSEADATLVGRPCVAENVQADGGEVGFEHPGGYGQYLLTEARLVQPLPAAFPLTTAVLIEPLAVCIRGLWRLRLEDRSRALIFGDGPIGMLMLLLLRREAVRDIVLVGGRPARLALAQELGAARVLNYHEAQGSPVDAISTALGEGFGSVIEASGSAQAMESALKLATVGGKVLVMGDYAQARADFPWDLLLHRELELIGTNASAGAWPEAVRTATEGALPLTRLISKVCPAERYAEAFDLMRSSREAVKVVLEWPDRLCLPATPSAL
jgi:threonine dehydrogenase-like Zn-dependent dehydrogenase